jgi:putative membrane protein
LKAEVTLQASPDIQGDPETLAVERTDLARQRNLLANERTFSAWVRTGLAAVVAGLGIARLLSAGEWMWMARVIGVILILTGGGIYVIAFRRYCQACRLVEQEGTRATPIWLMSILIVALILSSLLALVLLFQW